MYLTKQSHASNSKHGHCQSIRHPNLDLSQDAVRHGEDVDGRLGGAARDIEEGGITVIENKLQIDGSFDLRGVRLQQCQGPTAYQMQRAEGTAAVGCLCAAVRLHVHPAGRWGPKVGGVADDRQAPFFSDLFTLSLSGIFLID